MQILTKTNKVVKYGNVGEENQCRIATNSKAFEILSSRIYSRPYEAVVREISANAADAHLFIEQPDQPFVVHLPTSWEPWFSVQDSGPGLNHEDIVEVYTTYFGSGKYKTESNAYIGGFGLGALSPYSVCDNFSVISWHEGKKRSYALFLNEDRCPSYTLLGVEDCDSGETGIKVEIPVKNNEIQSYKVAAERVYKYFKVKPKITGQTVYIEEDYKSIEGKNWYLSTDASCGIIMGNIFYPINTTKLEKLNEDAKNLCGHGLVLIAGIGDVDIAASREELNYNKITVRYVIDRINQAHSEYSKTLQDKIDACESYYAACKYVLTLPIKPTGATYKGRKLEKSFEVKISHPLIAFHKTGYRGKIEQSEKKPNETTGCIPADLNFLQKLYFKDADKPHKRATEYLQSLGRYNRDTIWLADIADKQAFLDEFGCLEKDLNFISSLSYTPRANSKVSGIYLLENNGWSATTSVDFKSVPHGWYVEFFDKHMMQPYTTLRNRDVSNSYKLTRFLTSVGERHEIYGVQSKKIAKFKKQGWTNAFEFAYNALTGLLSNVEFLTFLDGIRNPKWENMQNLARVTKLRNHPICTELEDFLGYISEIEKANEKLELFNSAVRFDEWLDRRCNNIGITTYNDLKKQVEDKFPLLFDLCEAKVGAEKIYNEYLLKVTPERKG